MNPPLTTADREKLAAALRTLEAVSQVVAACERCNLDSSRAGEECSRQTEMCKALLEQRALFGEA